MIKPTSVITEESGTWGLARWKDGYVALIKLHECGDWFTVRAATQREVDYLKKHGENPAK